MSVFEMPGNPQRFNEMSQELSSRTSLTMGGKAQVIRQSSTAKNNFWLPWIWVAANKLPDLIAQKDFELGEWLKRGGMLIVYGAGDGEAIKKSIGGKLFGALKQGAWRTVPTDHSLMRSFYLLKSLKNCSGRAWQEFTFQERTTILTIPFDILGGIDDLQRPDSCSSDLGKDTLVKYFVNIVMLAMTSHYKSDQVHLPDILKRLR